ncbi:MAG: hypothetical protein HQM13_07470 [SAR324 cluster bacterium]|nr:hypothetical protein [SAR324 cluster bacterium]
MVKFWHKKLFLFFCLLTAQVALKPAFALEQVFYLLNFKFGIQNTGQAAPIGGKDDLYLKEIESEHGTLNENRLATPLAISFDFYQVDGSLATGFGMEINRYNKNYSFNDNSSVELEVQGVLFAFSTYYRGDYWFPYLSLGTGGYSVKIRENLVSTTAGEEDSKASFIDSAPSVFYYEIGSRFPLGEWGFLIAWRATSAQLKVQTVGERLELGGQTSLLGVYYNY